MDARALGRVPGLGLAAAPLGRSLWVLPVSLTEPGGDQQPVEGTGAGRGGALGKSQEPAEPGGASEN